MRPSALLLLVLPASSTAFSLPAFARAYGRRRIAATPQMCDNPPKGPTASSLQKALKQAAAEKFGASMESAMKNEDYERYKAVSSAMEMAIQDAKERFVQRKAEIGAEAALEELEAPMRTNGRDAASPPIMKTRPKLWLLDRDGCLNEDVGAPGVVCASDLRLIPGSAGAIRRLRLTGKVAIVTNQSARGKGLLSAAELDRIHEELRHQIAKTARGGLVGREQWDALYVCEDAGPSARKKPQPGLLLEAMYDSKVEPSEALMIGDSWSDVVAAHRAGCVGVLLATGHGASLGAILKDHGVGLPITLMVDEAAEAIAPTDYMKLQRSAADASAGGAAAAVEAYIEAQGEDEADLIWEALRRDVRVYADLSQAVDELMALPSQHPGDL
jgi:D-glycero-D-manno-heptose 1,7-bisphosphate phosphatase